MSHDVPPRFATTRCGISAPNNRTSPLGDDRHGLNLAFIGGTVAGAESGNRPSPVSGTGGSISGRTGGQAQLHGRVPRLA